MGRGGCSATGQRGRSAPARIRLTPDIAMPDGVAAGGSFGCRAGGCSWGAASPLWLWLPRCPISPAFSQLFMPPARRDCAFRLAGKSTRRLRKEESESGGGGNSSATSAAGAGSARLPPPAPTPRPPRGGERTQRPRDAGGMLGMPWVCAPPRTLPCCVERRRDASSKCGEAWARPGPASRPERRGTPRHAAPRGQRARGGREGFGASSAAAVRASVSPRKAQGGGESSSRAQAVVSAGCGHDL